MVKDENPEAGFGEIGKLLGAKWAEADEKTKEKVRLRAAGCGAVGPGGRRGGLHARCPAPRRTLTCLFAPQYNKLHDADKKRYDDELAACVLAQRSGRVWGGTCLLRAPSVSAPSRAFASRPPSHACTLHSYKK